jgi:hypothetical protein
LKEKTLLAGGASRFFSNFEPDSDAPPFIYATKASAADRTAGLQSGEKNTHPTVKGKALMAYLVRLVTPAGGLVLDPFAGSGSTLVAAITQGFSCVGIEKEAEYVEIAKARMAHAIAERAESNPLPKQSNPQPKQSQSAGEVITPEPCGSLPTSIWLESMSAGFGPAR